MLGLTPEPFPQTCMIGAMAHYITHADPKHFQPMNANFGILPLVQKVDVYKRQVRVDGDSMYPTLHNNAIGFSNILTYRMQGLSLIHI